MRLSMMVNASTNKHALIILKEERNVADIVVARAARDAPLEASHL